MNKDALLATLIGFGIGLLITGLLLVGPNILGMLPKINLPNFGTQQSQGAQATPTPEPKTFSVESPLPDSIENVEQLLVNGTAPAGSTIVIGGLLDEIVVSVTGDGKFAGKVTLTEGKNDITVTAITKGKMESKTITVFFTEEKV